VEESAAAANKVVDVCQGLLIFNTSRLDYIRRQVDMRLGAQRSMKMSAQ
jgi:hypothetical protein